MGRVPASLGVIGLAGCAQIFGIDDTTGRPDVALPPAATLTVERLSIGASIETNPQDLATVDGAWYIDDAAEPSGLRRIAATATGNVLSAELPDGVPGSVELTIDNIVVSYRLLLTFPNRDLKIYQSALEHPNPEPAPMGGSFNVSLTLPNGYLASHLLRLYAVGPWTQRDFLTSELPAPGTGVTAVGPVQIPFATTHFSSTVGIRPLQKLTSADKLVALRYVGSDLTAAGEVASFEQTGGTDSVSATLVETPHAPLDIAVNAMANATRLAQTTPTNPNLAPNWYLAAAPAWRFANASGIQLNAGAVAMTDTMITAPFANPFEAYGWNTLFVWNPSRSRTFTPPALALPWTAYSGVQHYLRPAAGTTVDVSAGLPVLVSVNGTPLTSDGLSVTIDPSKSVELDMVADKTSNTFYQFNIHELVPNPNQMPPTALEGKLVYVVMSPTTKVRIPAGVFVAGKVYSVRAHCINGGYPGLADGDLTNRDLPLTLGYFDSGIFTVAAP